MKVAVNGYGTIGKRVADAVIMQNDLQLSGVSKATPDYEAIMLNKAGINLYVPEDNLKRFEDRGISVKGTISEMVNSSDIIVDATPGGYGPKYKELYQSAGKPAIFQGGEDANLTDLSFSALCNYEQASGKRYLRVVSCNTTAILRTICSLRSFGIKSVQVDIIRRAADPREIKKGPINSITLDPVKSPSHHADDVKSVMPDLKIVTRAAIVPTTLMHLHQMTVRLDKKVLKGEVINALLDTPRIVLLSSRSGVQSTAEIMEIARDLGRKRADLPEVAVFEESINTEDCTVLLSYAVHQESIVVPENIDAIRAVHGKATKNDSIKMTDDAMGIKRGYLV
ncbi:MAG: type II glyceraldehyde-3-phosphate dehydrogenase [Nitrososphaerota archaeon]|jgi:glyceraldehyde-3-phosphate dehydrogenase (NAD(P))|nr:type II glyceraldehyde-3-phosphate dehydrogenase [Nitrososphaerota archaeon]MDG6932593.1 type II glyceraldehyde-3-phosphate dehydrogenase [Nitrososphaerota archaeon]MDG6935669.1 type II glyceraldehyde-3-phosphate dehydrogenase [Nitrososphaerota archaeon]MDG6943444.1 type II glyceraldehyde-3-phosphate dehydrogenase [Nitrososphaerota archaeon]